MADHYTEQLTIVNALLAGFNKALPGGVTTFTVQGTAYTQPELVAKYSAVQAVLNAVPAAARAHEDALEAREEADATTTKFLNDTQSAIRGALGSSSVTALAAYGLKPVKERKALTGEQNVVKATKAAATRKARGTLGKKQKAAIHGVVPAPAPTTPVVVTPAVTPKTP